MPVPKEEVLELMRMDVDPAEVDEIRELWKAHSKAEDNRSIEGLLATLSEDCVYTVYPDDVSWHGHEGAARFYTELLTAFPDIVFELQNIVIGPQGVVEDAIVGIIANQPSQMAGTLNIEAGEKASRFVRFCDAFSVPILTLVDVPGYLPGTDQEWTGVIRRGAKLLYAYAEATVPLVTVILRKAYGGAYIVMGSKQLGADINLAWPTAEIAVMGGQGAVNILYRPEIKRAEEAGEDVAAVRTRLANEYTYNVASPFLAAERGELDGIIEPAQTRVAVAKALRALRAKRASLPPKKHGNIPL